MLAHRARLAVAGLGADPFESFVGSIIVASFPGSSGRWVLLPLPVLLLPLLLPCCCPAFFTFSSL